MVDQLFGLILLGLGVKAGPHVDPNVKGEQTVATTSSNVPPFLRPFKEGLQNLRDSRKASGEAFRDQLRADRKALLERLRSDRQDFLETVQENRQDAKEEFESRREALKEKLEAMKDERRAAHIEKLNTNCQKINVKRTDRMSEMITKMSAILENVVNRAETAAENGKDTSSVDTAVTAANEAISDAQEAIAAQAATECVITINSETTAKNDVGVAISGLEKDLKAVFDKVKAAKKAVGDAIRALALVMGESLTPTPTP